MKKDINFSKTIASAKAALYCGVKRCETCGTPNWDNGPVCGNCGEDPNKIPEGTVPFNPLFSRGGCQ